MGFPTVKIDELTTFSSFLRTNSQLILHISLSMENRTNIDYRKKFLTIGMKKPRERASNLRALLSGTEIPKTWKLISGPPDVVTTAMLRAAARRTGGLSLSPLEERWLGVLSSFASDDEITQWGQIYMGNKETARFIDDKSILAVSVLQINNNTPDATKMLIKNAFAVMPELFTKPENTDVDISKFTNQGHSNNPKYTMAVVQSNTIVISFTNVRNSHLLYTIPISELVRREQYAFDLSSWQ